MHGNPVADSFSSCEQGIVHTNANCVKAAEVFKQICKSMELFHDEIYMLSQLRSYDDVTSDANERNVEIGMCVEDWEI